MTARYLLRPDLVLSRADGDLHFISAAQLAHLYGVPMSECLIEPRGAGHEQFLRRTDLLARTDLIHLSPRYDGNYSLPTKP